MGSAGISAATTTTMQLRQAYLTTNLSLIVGWSIAATCGDATCPAGDPIAVGALLTRLGDRPLRAVTGKLRCRICQQPPERVCLRQPAAGGGYIEYVVIAPARPSRND